MNAYLIDANVLCEPTKPVPNTKVVAWLIENEGDFFVDPIILGELRIGILNLAHGRKKIELERWFEAVVNTIDCMPWDATVSRYWAELVVKLKRKGFNLPLLDGMIAATALANDLTIVTRNTKDFQQTGVKVLNPFI